MKAKTMEAVLGLVAGSVAQGVLSGHQEKTAPTGRYLGELIDGTGISGRDAAAVAGSLGMALPVKSNVSKAIVTGFGIGALSAATQQRAKDWF